MKTFKKLSLVILLIVGLVACDAIKDMATLDIDNVKISKVVDISATAAEQGNGMKAPADGISFTKTAKVSLSSVTELKDYLTLIKSMNIDSVSVELQDVAPGIVKSLSLNVNPLNYDKTVTGIGINKPLSVSFTAAELKTVSDALLKNKELEFVLSGTVSEPVDFKIKLTVYSNFVVKVLQ